MAEPWDGRHVFAGRPGQLDSPSARMPGPFNDLCEVTGGLARSVDADSLLRDLTFFIKTLRGRLIIEFPRPKDVGSVTLTIHVTIADSDVFIRPAGSSATIPDSHVIADPNELQPEESLPPDTSTPVPNPVPSPPH